LTAASADGFDTPIRRAMSEFHFGISTRLDQWLDTSALPGYRIEDKSRHRHALDQGHWQAPRLKPLSTASPRLTASPSLGTRWARAGRSF
jgi:hypothetical protein